MTSRPGDVILTATPDGVDIRCGPPGSPSPEDVAGIETKSTGTLIMPMTATQED